MTDGGAADGGAAGRPSVTLRPATVADISQIVAWELAPHALDFVNSWNPARHRAAQENPAEAELIVEADGRPVGFVILAGLGDTGGRVPPVRDRGARQGVRPGGDRPGRDAPLQRGPRSSGYGSTSSRGTGGRGTVYERAGFTLDEIRADATTDRNGAPAPLAFYSRRR